MPALPWRLARCCTHGRGCTLCWFVGYVRPSRVQIEGPQLRRSLHPGPPAASHDRQPAGRIATGAYGPAFKKRLRLAGLGGDHRPVAGERQSIHRRARPVGISAVATLRRLPRRLEGDQARLHTHGARRGRERRHRRRAAHASANSQRNAFDFQRFSILANSDWNRGSVASGSRSSLAFIQTTFR